MKLKNKDYRIIDEEVVNIYEDYGLTSFPINVYELCKKMGIKLFKYSSFEGEDKKILLKKSYDGFFTKSPVGYCIFYNDQIENNEQINMTIAHEISHYVFEDECENEIVESYAKHFARYLLCPTPYLIHKEMFNYLDIMYTFEITKTAAINASNSALNRYEAMGDRIFDYEQPILELIQ